MDSTPPRFTISPQTVCVAARVHVIPCHALNFKSMRALFFCFSMACGVCSMSTLRTTDCASLHLLIACAIHCPHTIAFCPVYARAFFYLLLKLYACFSGDLVFHFSLPTLADYKTLSSTNICGFIVLLRCAFCKLFVG